MSATQSVETLDAVVPRAAKSTKPTKRVTRKRGGFNRRTPLSWLVVAFLVASAIAWISPLWLALVNGVKTQDEYVSGGPLALPEGINLDSIIAFWQVSNFSEKLWNSVQISLFSSLLAVTLSFLTAYAIGIGRIRFRLPILALFMVAFTIPGEALMYPLLKMSKLVGLYDNIWSLVIIFAVLQSAFGTYLLSSVLSEFPPEIVEAARIDGASSSRMMWSIVLPLSRPTMMVLMVFFFIWTWNEFLLPLVLLPSNASQTVSLSMGLASGQFTSDPTTQAAAALVGILPTLIFFLIFQRTLLRGVTMGSSK